MRKKIILFCSIILFTFSPLLKYRIAGSQSISQTQTELIDQNHPDKNTTTIITLDVIVKSIETLKDRLREKEEGLRSAKIEDQRLKIFNEISEINTRIEALEKNFEAIATGIDLTLFTSAPRERFDLKDELQDLLSPIIQEIKNMTKHPREIEKLRNNIAYYEERIPVIEKGINNIQGYIEVSKDERLREYLKTLKKDWSEKSQNFSNQLSVAQYQLAEKSKESKSFVKSIQNISRAFFKSRGRNLVLSLLAFLFVWLFFHFMYNVLNKFISKKKSEKRTIYARVISLIYHLLTFATATGALLLVLYISGDWVLLGLAIIFIFGMAWATRQALPRFWEQVKLLLNLGPVKEKERIVYNGLPWKVQSLNLFTLLVNPALKGGKIHLPLREFTGMHSRPYHPEEPWFPCKEGDWVILADGTYGKISNQTPEIVELVILGGSHKTYPTLEFLKQNPENISTNFRLNVTFGIDYQHQPISTREIPETVQRFLKEGLYNEGYEKDILNLRVEFKEAGTSSLDLEILADFSGRVAKDYNLLKRAIQRMCVEVCNKNGWIIPFTQLTIHTAGKGTN
ncbi:MAG: hypothetical protein ACMUHX_07770 [bacterium]